MRTLLFCLAASLSVAGCAIHQGPQGGYVFNMDLPEVFGTVMDKRPMPDGQSDVTLRKMGSQWSVKFGMFSRVLELPGVTGGKIVQVTTVGTDTNIVLQTRTAKCPDQYMLVSLKSNSEVSAWPLDVACGFPSPVVRTGATEQFLDFTVGQRVTRFVYRGGKLMRNRDVLLSPGMSMPGPMGEHDQAKSKVERRPYAAGLPFRPTAEQLQQRPSAYTGSPAPVATPAPSTKSGGGGRKSSNTGSAATHEPRGQNHLEFDPEPVKPATVIILGKS